MMMIFWMRMKQKIMKMWRARLNKCQTFILFQQCPHQFSLNQQHLILIDITMESWRLVLALAYYQKLGQVW